jgi:hypothetical protein
MTILTIDHPFTIHNHLVGGAITILKNMKVNGKDDIPYIMENKTCLKPPTRYIYRVCVRAMQGDSYPQFGLYMVQ